MTYLTPADQLAEQTTRRLDAAGIAADDPGLVQLRDWNAQARGRGRINVEVRRGQFGATRSITRGGGQ